MTTKKEGNKAKANDKTWTKGKSGNPGGRSPRVGPNGETVSQLARAKTKEMLGVLEELALNKAVEPRDRISAANSYLARAWGAVKASTEGEEPKTDLADVIAKLISQLPS